MTTTTRRATAYGLFNLAYGLSWFAGSAVMGWLYGRSLTWLLVFPVVAQLAAVPCFLAARPRGPVTGFIRAPTRC